MEVTERTAHYSQLPYIRPGMDANLFLRWSWNGGRPGHEVEGTMTATCSCRSTSNDDYIYANVYGVPDKVEVEMSFEPIEGPRMLEWVVYYERKRNGKVV